MLFLNTYTCAVRSHARTHNRLTPLLLLLLVVVVVVSRHCAVQTLSMVRGQAQACLVSRYKEVLSVLWRETAHGRAALWRSDHRTPKREQCACAWR